MRCPKCKLIIAEYFRLCPQCQSDLRELNELFGPFYEPHPEAFEGLFEGEGPEPVEDFAEDLLFAEDQVEEESLAQPEPEDEEEDLIFAAEEPEFDLEDLDLTEEEVSVLEEAEEPEEVLLAVDEAEEEELFVEEVEEEPLAEIREDLLDDLEEIGDLIPEDLTERSAT
ncbi:MAG: hypothetical protein GXO17_05885 [Thermodesulfobacteria bacterium]|nr:hypothetical protein [Thermodesulfobacteriota bacterium]